MKILLKKIKTTKQNIHLNPNIINQSGRDKKKVGSNTNAAERKKELTNEEISFFLPGLK